MTRRMTNQLFRDGVLISEEIVIVPAEPLDPTGALATLLAVLELSTVEDAANAVGLTPEDLVAEAEAWAMARTEDN